MDFLDIFASAVSDFLGRFLASVGLGDVPPLVLVTTFAAVALLVSGLGSVLGARNPMKRLERADAATPAAEGASVRYGLDNPLLARLVAPLKADGSPADEARRGALRRRLVRAGLYNPNAVLLYYASRIALGAGLPAVFILILPLLTRGGLDARGALFLGLGLMVLGFMLPVGWLSVRISERAAKIREGFPDALDLLLVCVEAGLGLDAAINRVGDEMKRAHPRVAEQLTLVGLELRAGRSRADALRNLADRVEVDEVGMFVNLLIQSDQLGTSVGDALRVYADEMRTGRMLRAEEKAHSLPVKLALPLVLFLLPALMVVILLPVGIQVIRVLAPIGG